MPYSKIKRGVIFAIVLAALWIPKSEAQQSNPIPQHQNQSGSYKQGTGNSPVAVDIVRAAQPEGTAEQQNKDREDKRISDNWLIGIGIVQCLIFAFQLWVFGRQATRLRETVKEMEKGTKATQDLAKAANNQIAHLEKSVGEASRSAAAMERVAESIAISAQAATESVATSKEIAARQKLAVEMQMRAYLTVLIGADAWYQERDKGIKFETRPLVVNTGHTPARNVTYRIKVDILPAILPPDFSFTVPVEIKGGSVIGPHQNATLMGGIYDGFVADQDVKDIRFLAGPKALYVWGVVNYIDAFGYERETKFGQIVYWRSDGTVYGSYVKNHNDAT